MNNMKKYTNNMRHGMNDVRGVIRAKMCALMTHIRYDLCT